MARFPRPQHALTIDQIQPGMDIWRVTGIYPVKGPSDRLRVVLIGALHEVRDGFVYRAESNTLWVKYWNTKYEMYDFISARDCNLDPDISYNDNYMFSSYEHARAAAEYLKELYELNPQERLLEEARASELMDMLYDDYDYDGLR